MSGVYTLDNEPFLNVPAKVSLADQLEHHEQRSQRSLPYL